MIPKITNFRARWIAAVVLAVGSGLLVVPEAGASLLEQVTVYGFEIRQSHGSKLRQHLIADMSRVAPDDVRSLIAENPICRVIMESDAPPVQVTSTLGRYYFRGPARTPDEGVTAPPLPVEVVTQWNTDLKSFTESPLYTDPSRGDILFSDTTETGRVHVDLGERGELHARHLLWSEQYQRFIALGGFEQRTVNERGDRIRTSGQVFTADDQFQNISYPGIAGQDIVIEMD